MSELPAAEPVTVLAVDDQPANLRLLEAVLTPRGYNIRTAGSGAEALDVLAKEDVDLVLLDIVMPGMDGYQVCRAIRADERLSFLPVVMITASGDQERLRALEAGADDFVAKPFDKAELLARVASLARVKRYHDTVRRQAAELADWNAKLADRVRSQVEELDRLGRLRRFLSPTARGAGRGCGRRLVPAAATVARSSWSSVTCGGSRRSLRPVSPKRSWRCSVPTTGSSES